MKDMLDRDIMVGDTLAYSVYHQDLGSELKLAKVTALAPFAAEVTDDISHQVRVISKADTMVICDWAKGSQAAP